MLNKPVWRSTLYKLPADRPLLQSAGPTRYTHFFFFETGFEAPLPHVQMPCPLPKMPMNAHCDCRAESSAPLRGASRNGVSVIAYGPEDWTWVAHARRSGVGT